MNREWECGIVDETVSRLIAMLLAGVIAFISIYRYVVFRFSGREFVHDAQVWAQIGDDVLAGMALYAQVPDNKPPLWEAVVIVAAATPVPFLVMLAVVGVGGAALVWNTHRLVKAELRPAATVVASFSLALGIVWMTNGFINNKIVALALLTAGLTANRPSRSGLLYGLGFLIAQHLLLAAPAVAWWEWRRHDYRAVVTIGGLALGTAIAGYVIVGLIWGLSASVAAVRQTMFATPAYAVAESQFQTSGSLLKAPGRYVQLLNERISVYTFQLVFATIGAAHLLSARRASPAVGWLGVALTTTLGSALLVRVYRHYWLLILPGLAILAGLGAEWLLPKYGTDE
ncbi:hypothetical protein ACFQJ5_15410 [Halomicroarcula sp. GCM10025324]|uniref:hypothetical protein n=1 Tax=Haloarcula TaxID=2237 RepID=UPI0023E8123F|nr:hypothetical protein [Halomicroarcula sp. ZS-22-S1]